MLSLNGCMDAISKFLFGKSSLFKELCQQGIVRFRDQFNQLAMKLEGTFFPGTSCGFLAVTAPAVCFVGDDVTTKNIQNLVEIRARVHRHIERKYAWTKMCPSLREDFVEIRVLFVHRVDHDDFWDSALIGEIRNAFCA